VYTRHCSAFVAFSLIVHIAIVVYNIAAIAIGVVLEYIRGPESRAVVSGA
jgi:hypothetical protein